MKKIELILGFKCNARCLFCVVDEETAKQNMSAAAAVRHMKSARREGAAAVDFGGGEPTLRKDLPQLARIAAKLGYDSIGVKTNGLRLCYPEYVRSLMDAGITRFTVPIWGHTPAVHDRFSRVEGSFEMLEMALKHILDFGGDVEADVLLTTESVPHLRELVGHFQGIGIKRFQMWLYSLFGSRGRMPEMLPTLTSAGKAIVQAARSFRGKKLHFSSTHVPPCFLRPSESIYSNLAKAGLVIITPGGSFPAESSPFEAGVKTAGCRGCLKRASCGGVRPEYLQMFSGTEIKAIAPKKTRRRGPCS